MKLYIIVTFIAAILLIILAIVEIIERVKTESFYAAHAEEMKQLYEDNQKLEEEVYFLKKLINHTKFSNSENPISGECSERQKKRFNDSHPETPFCFGENKDEDS